MRKNVFLLMLGMAATGLLGACGDNECEEAADKLAACMASVDCSQQAQPANCETAKQMAAMAADVSGSCEGEAKQAAQQILDCELDPALMCNCKQTLPPTN
jgi:hypothetical protein